MADGLLPEDLRVCPYCALVTLFLLVEVGAVCATCCYVDESRVATPAA